MNYGKSKGDGSNARGRFETTLKAPKTKEKAQKSSKMFISNYQQK